MRSISKFHSKELPFFPFLAVYQNSVSQYFTFTSAFLFLFHHFTQIIFYRHKTFCKYKLKFTISLKLLKNLIKTELRRPIKIFFLQETINSDVRWKSKIKIENRTVSYTFLKWIPEYDFYYYLFKMQVALYCLFPPPSLFFEFFNVDKKKYIFFLGLLSASLYLFFFIIRLCLLYFPFPFFSLFLSASFLIFLFLPFSPSPHPPFSL